MCAVVLATAGLGILAPQPGSAGVAAAALQVGVGSEAADLQVSPNPVPMGYISPGASQTATVTIKNVTAAPVTVTGWAATNQGHAGVLAGNCNGQADGTPVTLGAGASCQASVTFSNSPPPPTGPYPLNLENSTDSSNFDPSITNSSGFSQPFGFSGFAEASSSGPNCLPSTDVPFPEVVVGMARTADDKGYWLINSNGRLAGCGDDTAAYGDPYPLGGSAIAAIAAVPSGTGYDMSGTAGDVTTFGNAQFYGSMGNIHLNKPVVGMASTPDGKGYWLVAGDGGVFAFGDTGFYGSMGGQVLNAPVVGMAATPDGGGYWLVASDGGVFAFGDAQFSGSMGGQALNAPVAAMAADPATGGYWLAGEDGGIFAFDAPFLGSLPQLGVTPVRPVVAMTAAPGGAGYRLAGADGGIFAFGSSGFYGSSF